DGVTLVGHLRVPGRCAEKRHHDGLVGAQPTDQSLPRQRSTLHVFKYAAAHNGIDSLADYRTDITADTRKVTNPARTAARAEVTAAEAALAAAERALPQLLDAPGTPKQKNAELPGVHRHIDEAKEALEAARAALRPIPAKIAANEVNPDARLARHLLARRGLQMVLRLLGFNAEAWLAEHFNAYLADPNEYRAILRNLLHQGATIAYGTEAITVTLDRPDSPRVARAFGLLAAELNVLQAHLPGDPRPITYELTNA
ncbi:MAG: putative transposase, partial [Acidimicrobiales bacterium]